MGLAGELLDDAGDFLLEGADALEDDLIGLEGADGLNVEEEARGHGVEVEGFAFLLWAAVVGEVFLVDGPLLLRILLVPVVQMAELVSGGRTRIRWRRSAPTLRAPSRCPSSRCTACLWPGLAAA